jgi:predicted dehydrogenase/aryl-alcohol dehydrogenase-like predicted oxidoreductase
MTDKLSWGIIGTGNIAKTFAKGVRGSKTGTLYAVGSRSQASADKFGDEFKIPQRYSSYEALLADKKVNAVYISTPHPLHARWAIAAAEAGKHILCEKPIGINHPEAMAIVEAAQRHGVFLMEAFMYRCHPQIKKLIELIRDKTIGDVKMIQTAFSFHAGFNAESRLFANKLAGGGILDVGCYCTSMARLVAGVALGKDFADPISVKAVGFVGSSNVDEYTAAILKFPGEIVAQVSTGVSLNQENVVRIYGTQGNILISDPWIPNRDGGSTKIRVQKNGQQPQEIVVETKEGLYSLEADTVGENISRKQAPSPAMSWDDTLGNMKTMDLWREQIGLVYDAEKAENLNLPVNGRPLAIRSDAEITTGKIPGLDKPVSRLVLGVDNQPTAAHGFVMFDDFFERGGNTFDTSYHYGGGKYEKMLGQWIASRKIRDKVVILGKGAHTPNCNPKALTEQLKVSFERMGVDHVDIYMLHRDNPDVPVGEFIDVLNEHKAAGRMKVFGGSNWSIERIEAANTYAAKKGIAGMTAISNNFSLARMVNPIWAGCISASDPKSRAWFTKTQLALLPWSSQARGFFTDRANPNDTSDGELVTGWYAEDNWKRRERVLEMAKKRNVLPINIALAYVLCQPFPTFPLIGTRVLSELRTSLPGLSVKLTPEDLKWLNLES